MSIVVFCSDNLIGLRKHFWACLFWMFPERTLYHIGWGSLMECKEKEVVSYWVFLSVLMMGARMAATLFLPEHPTSTWIKGWNKTLFPPKESPQEFPHSHQEWTMKGLSPNETGLSNADKVRGSLRVLLASLSPEHSQSPSTSSVLSLQWCLCWVSSPRSWWERIHPVLTLHLLLCCDLGFAAAPGCKEVELSRAPV